MRRYVCDSTCAQNKALHSISRCDTVPLKEAGCPDGVVSVIHGQHDTVNFICDHPDIK